jgi:hypothetical protein
MTRFLELQKLRVLVETHLLTSSGTGVESLGIDSDV